MSRNLSCSRGYDLTVEPASIDEEHIFSAAIEDHLLTQLDVSTEAVPAYKEIHYKPGAVTRICLPPLDGDDRSLPRKLLISRPITTPLSVIGNSTRAYWAVEDVGAPGSSKPRVVLLKDTWRLVGPGAEVEGDVIRELNQRGVRNVPSVVYHWDVCDPVERVPECEGKGKGKQKETVSEAVQTTITRDLLNHPWVCGRAALQKSIVARTHYRLVLDIAGLDLLTLSGTHELLHGAYDAYEAMTDAYTLANRLHCDIHPGNIILYRDPNDPACNPSSRKGYLIDWDHSRVLDGHVVTHEYYEPSLQWQFASNSLLARSSTGKVHEFEDDMESMFYVVLYCALLRLEHNLAYHDLVGTLNALFDLAVNVKENTYGGHEKLFNKLDRRHTGALIWRNPHLQTWIDTVCDYMSPISTTPADRVGKWSADHLRDFWRDFLQTHHPLPRADGYDNVWLNLADINKHAPRSVQNTPNEATTTAGSKRSRSEDEQDISSSKFQRTKTGKKATMWSSLLVPPPVDPISPSVVNNGLADILATNVRASSPVPGTSSAGRPSTTLVAARVLAVVGVSAT
ncbi:hypothetical protein NUW54_g8585 [Trametes sanguinea]|uniref:Uncharacterized protein n=1 Tax=Trametes sanguinea TaxID=158606 RepID=A0ACC1PCA7_9APHY|nr:hypothetical protein NUW54_g8585 [Trametes sanguinea]